jgi:aspartyl/asparaginyl-tRNA synthetase
MSTRLIVPRKFHAAVRAMRTFFEKKGFVEVHTQNALSILAACEDPETVSKYNYQGEVWPLPQTGQMWLEDVLLNNPDIKGCFTVSTSYRNEPNPVPGRHDLIFPMFEFESKGGQEEMIQLEKELLEHMGFDKRGGTAEAPDYPEVEYRDMMDKYGSADLEHEHEQQMEKDYGPVLFLKNFPYHTSPFWNMKKEGETAAKVDIIVHGIETIGSAERSCDKEEMRQQFLTISDGGYANLLFEKFGHKRVYNELDAFLDRDFFPRFGGGIGVTRMIRAMEMSNLTNKWDPNHEACA